MSAKPDRAAYIAGLRELADRLERHPDAPMPFAGNSPYNRWLVMAHSAEEMREAARCYGGAKVEDERHGVALIDGIPGIRTKVIPVYGACERVEVGTDLVEQERDVCPVCAEPIIDPPDDPRRCSSPSGATHWVESPPARRTVMVEQPRYEVRCPDSLLALGTDAVADAVANVEG